ncbi:hypothetical protein [Paraflavitalea speifideaquila]|uniref:hypothetical protein n=1 Tax=Paraflavitalea speifideaquila TaxID=3076558 RepID=UPI0028EC9277|nr:hypothetical protein [Paraflavitalea speifideiaquila]
MRGKLDLPANGAIRQLVIFIHGTGPATYLDRRKAGDSTFNYFDLFAREFNKRNIAFLLTTKGV